MCQTHRERSSTTIGFVVGSGSGNANFGMQARQAGEHGGGDPSMRPRGTDKRAVVVLLVGLAALVAGLLIFA
jgi:hypothetical protein